MKKIFLILITCHLFLAPATHADWNPNTAVTLNGSNSYLSCASTTCRSALSPLPNFTIDTWIYIDGFTTDHDFAGVISMPGSYQLVVRASGTGTNALPYLQLDYLSGGIAHQLQVPASLPQRTWYQVSLQFTQISSSSLNAKIFINGIQFASQTVASTNGQIDPSSDVLYLGKSRSNSRVYFPGKVDEIRLSSTARYSSHFTKPTGPYTLDDQVIALYHFEENAGTSALDAGPQQHNLTLSQASWHDANDINQALISNCAQTGNNTLTLGPDSDALLSYVTSKLLTSGQTLLLCDGTYRGAIAFNNQRFVDKDTGIGTPVTVKAINDGKVILAGAKNIRKSGMVQLFNTSGVNLEGVHATNCYNPEASQCSPLEIYYESSYLNLKRFTGNQDDPTAVAAIFNLSGTESADTHHLTLEDVAAYGYGRLGIMVSTSTHHVTLRRFFTLTKGFQGANTWCINVELYGGHDHIVENNVAFIGTTNPLPCRDTTDPNHIVDYPFHGFIVPGTNQQILGSIVKNGAGNAFYFTGCSQCLGQDLVSLNSQTALNSHYGAVFNRGRFSSNLVNNTLTRFSWINADQPANGVMLASDSLVTDSIRVTHSYFSSPYTNTPALANYSSYPAIFSHYDNRFSTGITSPLYGGLTPGTNEAKLEVNWNIDKYGDGVYLMASKTPLATAGTGQTPVGADILYRYENGVLTDTPLWPWPMEDRIKQETGISVTWAQSGGIWKTLDGVYHPTPPPNPFDYDLDGDTDYLDLLSLLYDFSNPFSIFDFNKLIESL